MEPLPIMVLSRSRRRMAAQPGREVVGAAHADGGANRIGVAAEPGDRIEGVSGARSPTDVLVAKTPTQETPLQRPA